MTIPAIKTYFKAYVTRYAQTFLLLQRYNERLLTEPQIRADILTPEKKTGAMLSEIIGSKR